MRPVAERFGHQELDRVKWRARAIIIGLALSAVAVTLIALPPVRLLYLFQEWISEAEISGAIEAARLHGLTALLVVLVSGLILFGLRRVPGRTRASKAAAARAMPLHAPPLRVDRTGATYGGKQLKRPSFLPEPYTNEAKSGQAAGGPHGTGPSAQSAAGFLMRFRQSLTPGENEDVAVTHAPPMKRLVRHPRFRRVTEAAKGSASVTVPRPDEQHAIALKPHGLHKPRAEAAEPRRDETGPALTSFDTLLSHVFAAGQGGAPRALLVGGATADVDATAEAVSIARALTAGGDQVVLVDLTCGESAISGMLGVPVTPGLAELFAGRAGFKDIVKVDTETPLQVIAAGDRKFAASIEASEYFALVFEALTQAYDGVVLYADHEALQTFVSALRFEVSVAIVVVDAAAGAGGAEIASEYSGLGCRVLAYEKRSGSISLAAASNE